jgi:hypothetical protein
VKDWEEHAIESARVVSQIKPNYLAGLTLFLEHGAPLLKNVDRGEFNILTPWEILLETEMFIQNLDLVDTIYRTNHASNYFKIAGILNKDKDIILEKIRRGLEWPDIRKLSVDHFCHF